MFKPIFIGISCKIQNILSEFRKPPKKWVPRKKHVSYYIIFPNQERLNIAQNNFYLDFTKIQTIHSELPKLPKKWVAQE